MFFSASHLLLRQTEASGFSSSFETGFDGWESYLEYGGGFQRTTAYARTGSYSVEQYGYPSSDDPTNITGASMIYPVDDDAIECEMDLWVFVAERTSASAASQFGFLFEGEKVLWDIWGGFAELRFSA
jgi:hypothetical protein